MIFVTGDTHGDFSKFTSRNFPEGKNLTKDDYVIIAGDFGGIWDVNLSSKHEQYQLDWLENKPWTTLFIDGNHENFDRLNAFQVIKRFNGPVGLVRNCIYHLKRGEIYILNNKSFFVFGGSRSEDKESRTEFMSWWSQEQPNYHEFAKGFQNLDKYDNKVDYIITHTAPDLMRQKFGLVYGNKPYDLPDYFDQLFNKVDFKRWFCGHFHFDYSFPKDKFEALYERIGCLNEDGSFIKKETGIY